MNKKYTIGERNKGDKKEITRKRNKITKWLHFNITCKLFKDPAITALGLVSGIRYNLGLAKEGRDFNTIGTVENGELEQNNFIKMLSYTTSKNLKVVIMRVDEESTVWHAWLCEGDSEFCVGADCCINEMKISDVLTILAEHEIKTEIRYDYFYWDWYLAVKTI